MTTQRHHTIVSRQLRVELEPEEYFTPDARYFAGRIVTAVVFKDSTAYSVTSKIRKDGKPSAASSESWMPEQDLPGWLLERLDAHKAKLAELRDLALKADPPFSAA